MRITGIVVATALVLASCGGDDEAVVDPASSTATTTVDESVESDDLFSEVETDDEAAEGVDTDADESADDSVSDPDDSDPVSTDATTVDADTADGDAPAVTTADPPDTTPAAGTTGGSSDAGSGNGDSTVATGDDAICVDITEVADGFDLVDDADSDGSVEDLRTAYRSVIDALGNVRDRAAEDVVSDIDLITVGIELIISSDVDGDELTDDQNDILSGPELNDAGDRFETLALDTCGVELLVG